MWEAALLETAHVLIQLLKHLPSSSTAPRELSSPAPRRACVRYPHFPPGTLLCHPNRQRSARRPAEASNLTKQLLTEISHQGFHSGGNGATMPSLASHISSGSFSGSIPMSLAKSWISRKQNRNLWSWTTPGSTQQSQLPQPKRWAQREIPTLKGHCSKLSEQPCVSVSVLPGW